MKRKGRIIGWIFFGLAAVVYFIATFYFGIVFGEVIADYESGETAGLAAVFLIFLIFGSSAYIVSIAFSIIGTLVANIRRGEQKFFFAPIITLGLSVLTWIIFLLIGVLM